MHAVSTEQHFKIHPDCFLYDSDGVAVRLDCIPLDRFTHNKIASRALTGAGQVSNETSDSRSTNDTTQGLLQNSTYGCVIQDRSGHATIVNIANAVRIGCEFCVVPFDEHDVTIASGGEGYFQALSAGSSGTPKRIRRTHQSWIASFKVNASLAEIDTTDCYAILGRLSHSLPLYATLEAAWLGANIVSVCDVSPQTQLSEIIRLKVSILYATPTQLQRVCKAAKSKTNHTVRCVFCGGGRLSQDTQELISQVFPNATLREFYGASETSFITISDHKTPAGSCGRAYPDVNIKLSGIENEDKLCEVWVKSPYLFSSYADAQTSYPSLVDGYISVGEMGWMDEDGYLYLEGRKDRMVCIADQNVFPEHIEKRLQQIHPCHCCIIALQDTLRGHVLIAVIEGVEDDRLRSQLLKALREQLGNLVAPKSIVFIQQLPLLSSGKTDITTLTLHVIEQLATGQNTNQHD